MKILVIGKARHGKTVFSSMLAEFLGCQYCDTSEALVMVETARQRRLGIDYAPMCWDDDRDRPDRAHLVATGDAVKAVSPTFWADLAWARARICTGVRTQGEYDALRMKYNFMTVYEERLNYEDEDPKDNFDIEVQEGMLRVRSGSIEGLRTAARNVARAFQGG